MTKEEYRKKPIFGTDFSKPVSRLIEGIRSDIAKIRGRIHDIEHGTHWGERVEHVAGLLTCGLVALHAAREEITKHEIESDDIKHGPSLRFAPRGIGLDICPGCFVCGSKVRSVGANDYLNNIAAFVESKMSAEVIAAWFGGWARVDFRESEPNRIQVKVGACDAHLPNLESVFTSADGYGRLRKRDVDAAKAL